MVIGNTATLPLVLIVDDFQDNREMFAEFLSISGFRVAEATNGREAVDMAFDLLPDVILMDLSLPELDGWSATRLLKADDRTKSIPVLALKFPAGRLSESGDAEGCSTLPGWKTLCVQGPAAHNRARVFADAACSFLPCQATV